MLKLFFWLRYLRKRRIVLLSIAAVALSVALLIVVASLFSGFIKAFEQSAVDVLGDVVLIPPKPIPRYPQLLQQLRQSHCVVAASPTLTARGLLHLGKGNVRAVEVWGIEPASRAQVTALKNWLLLQRHGSQLPSFHLPEANDTVGGFVGIGLLAEPNERTDQYDLTVAEQSQGKRLFLTTGAVLETTDSNDSSAVPSFKRRLIPFVVADVFFAGIYDLDRRFVFLPIERLQDKLHPDADEPLADRIHIKLRPDADPYAAIAEIRGRWRTFAEQQLGWSSYLIDHTDIETAQALQSRYIAELHKQMGMLLLIFGVVSFSAVVLIFCIFFMIVRLKQRDIAIIKSCGAASSTVAFIFLGFGLCVGIVGSAVGAVLGYAITKNVNTIEGWIRIAFGLKLWKSSVYMFSEIPNQVSWTSVADIVLATTVAAALGALIPALVAARTRPVEILRYE